jgi:hypothetical protein
MSLQYQYQYCYFSLMLEMKISKPEKLDKLAKVTHPIKGKA